WRYKHRAALGQPTATLAGIAAQTKLAPQYLAMVWQALEQTKGEVGPLVKLQAMWRQLPDPKGNQPRIPRADIAPEGCVRMRRFVVKIRRHTQQLYPPLQPSAFP